jgi:prepilin-type processing-associated H-X9-DG protein
MQFLPRAVLLLMVLSLLRGDHYWRVGADNLSNAKEDAENQIVLTPRRVVQNAHVLELATRKCSGPYSSYSDMFRFDGVPGALHSGDCVALFFVAIVLAAQDLNRGAIAAAYADEVEAEAEKVFLYVEIGSYLGCSAHIVTEALKWVGVKGSVYAHDLWDMGSARTSVQHNDPSKGSIWNSNTPPPASNTRFMRFYSHVQRRNIGNYVVPVMGNSEDTLPMHNNESANMVFVDGSHTHEGVYADLVQAWRIVKPGGVVLGHDCLPHEIEQSTVEEYAAPGVDGSASPAGVVRGVRSALEQFTWERGLEWQLFYNSVYMFIIQKEGGDDDNFSSFSDFVNG